MFTATGTQSPCSCHVAICDSAIRITLAVSSGIMPACSAAGMNWSGLTHPRRGCSQRASASTPIVARSVAASFGW